MMPSDAPAKVPRDALVMPSPGVGFQNHLSEFPHAFRKVCSTGTLGLHARRAAAASPKERPARPCCACPTVCSAPQSRRAMVGVRVTVAAGGLHPLEACKAWYLRTEEERPWHEVQEATTTVDGQTPKMHALRNAVDRVAVLEAKQSSCS